MSILTFKNVQQIRSIPRQQRQQIRTMNKKDFQLLRCLYVHDIVYTIFITFPSAYGIYEAITRNSPTTPMEQAIKNFCLYFATFIHHIPYCASFFIFMGVSKTFRQEIKRLLYRMCGKNLMPIREEASRQQIGDREHVQLQAVVSTIEIPL